MKTPLYESHCALNAKMTDFHGWKMPVYYTSILDEHQAVREAAGIFDISHMGQVVIEGPNAEKTLNALVVSDLTQVAVHRACYTLMLNESAGIIDDLIIYRLGENKFLVIVNCSRREVDVAWLKDHCTVKVDVVDLSSKRGIIAVQGPKSGYVLDRALGQSISVLGRFDVMALKGFGSMALVARTGYTGSDGFECFVEEKYLEKLWEALLREAAPFSGKPVGLGARDALRIEAGLRLYGTDMDEATTPYEAGLGWTVALNTPQFVGQERLLEQKATGPLRRLVGFCLEKGPVPRTGFKLFHDGKHVGEVTSGTFSPILKQSLGMGYIAASLAQPGNRIEVEVRDRRYDAEIVKMPFWKADSVKTEISGSLVS